VHFVAVSLGAHALAVAALVRVAQPGPVAQPPAQGSIEIAVLPPAAPPAPPAPSPAPTEAPGAMRATLPAPRPPHRPEAPARPAPVGPVAPPAPVAPVAPPAFGLGMRAAPRATAPSTEVQVPRASTLGQVEGPPPDDQLPAAALGGPITGPHLPGPLAAPGAPGQAERLGPGVVGDGDGGYRDERTTFIARVGRDGSVRFDDKANVGVDGLSPLSLVGHFDLTDALMRAHGEDPYRYEKQRFMEATRDERAGMAVTDRSERLHDAVARMPRYLEKVWAHTAWSAAERRAALFALWDEVAEHGDDELVKTGVAVRAAIVGFIRRRLPAGSADAYPPAEVELLNRRRSSHERFEPYR
jgi:hypothetical protein